MYYDEHIRDQAEQAFDQKKATFEVYDSNFNEVDEVLDEELNEQSFIGAMREMVAYIYELRNDVEGECSTEMLWNSENIEEIYITARGLEAPTVIVEYEKTPEWFQIQNADLREFYWHPNPAMSGEWTAAYFQPR